MNKTEELKGWHWSSSDQPYLIARVEVYVDQYEEVEQDADSEND